jgi:hypothetical protein
METISREAPSGEGRAARGRVPKRSLLFLSFMLFFIAFSFTEGIDVARSLTAINVPFEERALFHDYGGFGTSLRVSLTPDTKPMGSIAMLVSLNSSSFTQEVLLAFIEKIHADGAIKSPITVNAAFLADEYSALPADMWKSEHTGLEDLCAILPQETILAYLDFDVPPQRLLFTQGAKGRGGPLVVVEPLPLLCKQRDIPYVFAASNNAFFRLSLMDGNEAVRFAWEQGFNALFVSGETAESIRLPIPPIPFIPAATSHTSDTTPALTAENIAGLLVDYVNAIDWTVSQTGGTRFVSSTNAAGQVRFVSEQVFVMIMLVCTAFLLIPFLVYSIAKSHLFAVQMRIFLAYSWVLFLFIALFFAVVQGVGVFVSFVSRAVHIFDVWTASLKVVISFLTYSLMAVSFDKVKIPGKQRFFGSAALLLGVVNLLVAMFIDITLAPIFMIALVCIIVGVATNLTLVCYIAALLIPLQSIGLFIEFLGRGSGELTKIIMDAGVWVNLAIASWTAPIWFILKRGNLLLYTAQKRHKSVFLIKPKLGLLARVAFLFIFLFIAVRFLFYQINIIPTQTASVRREAEAGDALILDVKESIFLGRRMYEISVQADVAPCRFDITLEANTERSLRSLLFSCSAPLQFDGPNIELVLGENPPNPFLFKIIFMSASLDGFNPTLNARAVYADYDPRIDRAGEPETEDYTFTIKGDRALREGVNAVPGRTAF